MPNEVFIPDPTWSNHLGIVQASGLNFTQIPYFNPETKGLDYKKYRKAIR